MPLTLRDGINTTIYGLGLNGGSQSEVPGLGVGEVRR